MWSLFLAVGLALATPQGVTPRVAVADLANHTGDASLDGAGPGLAGILVAKLVRVDNLQVVERSQLEAVLSELHLGQGGAIDPATAAKAGKLLGATHIVTGDLVSVKLPTLAVNLRVIEVETGRVVAATDVVGQIGEHGEEFFVLVDEATFRIIDALKVQLVAKDRIELGQVDVQQLTTVDAYGRALSALDRGDSAAAEVALGRALAVEPGFKLAEATLAKLAAEVASTRTGYANDAMTRAHAAWDDLETHVAGTLPEAPDARELAIAALRAQVRLVRGDLEGYLLLERGRLAATTPALTKESGKFQSAASALLTDSYVRAKLYGDLTIWPWEVRMKMADVLLILGRKEEAGTLVLDTYQHPGPTAYVNTRPRNPTDWADRHGFFDLAVIGRKQLLTQWQLRGDDTETRRALDKLDDAIKAAREAHERRASWDSFQARYAAVSTADTKFASDEERVTHAILDDPALQGAAYRAFQARVKGGFYANIRDTDAFADLADAWRRVADHLWSDTLFADQRLANLLDLQAAVPARDAEDDAHRRAELESFATSAYRR